MGTTTSSSALAPSKLEADIERMKAEASNEQRLALVNQRWKAARGRQTTSVAKHVDEIIAREKISPLRQ